MRLSPPWLTTLALCALLAACGRAPGRTTHEIPEATADGLTLADLDAMLRSAPPADRPALVRRMKAFGTNALPTLGRLLEGDDARVREAAVRTIGALAPSDPVWAGRLGALLRDGTPGERTAAGSALGAMGSVTLPVLDGLLQDDDEKVRVRAALVLTHLPRTEALSELQVRLVHDTSWIVRREAARGLGARDAPRRDPQQAAVRTLLDDSVPVVQSLACDAATAFVRDHAPMRDALRALLRSPHGAVRGAAAEALGRTPEPEDELVARLKELAEADPSPEARVRAAVGHYRATREADVARRVLAGALEHRRADVRRLALRGIGTLGDDAGPLVELVAARLRDRTVRVAAIDSLATLGPAARAVIPELRRLRAGAKPFTAQRIDAALEQIDG